MLVLSRMRDEEIVIQGCGDEVRVKVVDIRGDRVRLGFTAPRRCQVDRAEVLEEIRAEELAKKVSERLKK